MTLLVTGAAGFIGFHLAKYYLEQGEIVFGLDNLNNYYDVKLKLARLELLRAFKNFIFLEGDISDNEFVLRVFKQTKPRQVVNLAAQAGVRYSLTNPNAYVQSNLVGFAHVIEACRLYQIEHLVYASTSSVYGANTQKPYKEEHSVNHPLTIYAATKKANELMAHSYSNLYGLPTTGLRFFTVYGPWGRPDMAFFSFTKDILAGNPIEIFNEGRMQRDFTYIDDIVSGLSKALEKKPLSDEAWDRFNPNPATSYAPYKIYNLGFGTPINLLDYIDAIETSLNKKARKHFVPMQQGDVLSTHADISRMKEELGYIPKTSYQEGIEKFIKWYLEFYP